MVQPKQRRQESSSKIGGYQIHSFPEIYTPSDRIIFPHANLISTAIDPHCPLEPGVIIKQTFMLSVGVHLLVFGRLVLPFPDMEKYPMDDFAHVLALQYRQFDIFI